MITRRHLLRGASAAAVLGGLQGLLPAWARGGLGEAMPQHPELTGTDFDLVIDDRPITVDGRRAGATTINGTVPGPLLRFREGDTVTLRVTNRLREDASIHWHGLILPNAMDGVPKVTFPGIRPDETFVYRYTLQQNGTYWYHSHSRFQEQSGVYGPMIIDPAGPDPVGYDREYVVMLSDWTFENPERVFARLKKMSDYYNFQQRTVGDFFADVSKKGLGATLEDRLNWGRMRMDPTDIADVTGATYTYLLNGQAPSANWTGVFAPGERVRLRFINGSAMSYFNVRIPGLPMTVVQADGQNVRPVAVDEFQIAVAETYDVVVEPRDDRAYAIMAESMDRSGYARGTLAPNPGMSAAVPPLRKRPLATMKDMGMAMEGMDGMDGMDQGATPAPAMNDGAGAMPGMDHGATAAPAMNQGGGAMSGMDPAAPMAPSGSGMPAPAVHAHPTGVSVANTAEMPQGRLEEPGQGLNGLPHRVLAYTDLRSLEPGTDHRDPGREIELHLTGNMERYMWSFDGREFSNAKGPIALKYGERVRLTMVNDTMMAHPIHLHGMFFEPVNGAGMDKPRKHTINVKPGERASVDVTADARGDWAFHCHLLYHMEAGMFQVVSVSDQIAQAPTETRKK